jgi:hypothetical protein
MPSKKQPFGETPKMQRPPTLRGLSGKPADPEAMESSSGYQSIIRAIDKSSVLAARYRDDPDEREFVPTRVGTLKGSYAVEAFQVKGFSESGLAMVGGWRCFVLDELKYVRDVDRIAHPGDRESEQTSCFDTVVYPPA